MARMIPAVDPLQLEHVSEAPVYRALRDQLSDQFVVLHSYPWLRPWRGEGALVEGEADFVVVHPEHGILVLEVKGGDTIRHDGARWFRETANGHKEFQDPFRQAQRCMHALLDIVEERSARRLTRRELTHGYAVVLPHMDYEGAPPPHADRAIVISRRHLAHLEEAIMTAYRAWTAGPRSLTRAQYSLLLDECLMPRFRVFRPIGPEVTAAAERLLELTEQQAQVFEGLYAQDRVWVEGVAGSGKTFLALHRALAFARAGRRTLFVCYNKELAAWLRRQVADDPRLAEERALLTVRHFHALASELSADAGLRFEPAAGGPKDVRFWDDEVPDLLEQAVFISESRGRGVRFEALVVDEAQDFSTAWWYALTQSVLSTPDAPLYAFLDPHQSLFGALQPPPVAFQARFHLKVNCRNTRRIAATSAQLLRLNQSSPASAPVGVTTRVIRAGGPAQHRGLVLQELRRLLGREGLAPSQIAVIGPRAKANGSLAEVTEVQGARMVTSAEQWRDGAGVLVTTARSFKGLEADVVLLYDLGGDFGPGFRPEDLYVACTRARAALIAVAHGGQCRAAIEAAVAGEEVLG